MPVNPNVPLDPEAERRLRKTLKQKVRRARKREERNQARAREQTPPAYDATSELQTEDWGQDGACAAIHHLRGVHGIQLSNPKSKGVVLEASLPHRQSTRDGT